MLVVVTLTLALQVTVKVGPQTREDSLKQRRSDSLSIVIQESIRNAPRDRRPARRDSVTPELERSAFADAGARDLLHRARAARMAQDSSLQSYDAKTYQRISVGLGFRAIGRERLLARTEVASRVKWRSEEHTSELQSQSNLVCRLLLEKKKKKTNEKAIKAK